MQHWTMSSAMSVSRSLTRISGSRPVRSASAVENTATFWNARSASTWRSGSSAGQPFGAGRELAHEALARRQLVERIGIDQLVEQQRKVGDLAREESADRADIDEAVERRRLLLEQRQVG